MAFFGAGPAAESAAQTAAATQALQGVSGLQEFGTINSAAASSGAANLLIAAITAQTALANLGLAGPAYGVTPYDLAYNAQFASFVNSLVSSLSATRSTNALLTLGASAQLANSGRRFLLSTYYGV